MNPCQADDTFVVKDGGSSAGVLIALIALAIVLAGAWYFVMGPGAAPRAPTTSMST